MRAETITLALGGRWSRGRGVARCPAHDDRTPSLSLRQANSGRLLAYCHAGCSFEEVVGALRDRGILESGSSGWPPTDSHRTLPAEDAYLSRRHIERAQSIWTACSALPGTLAERYLRSRSIAGSLPRSLRFHPSLHHLAGHRLPTMVAAIETEGSAGLRSIHRTYLDPSGSGKAHVEPVKAILGPCAGGAVRLRTSGKTLVVCEGIETGLSLAEALPGCAVWAALSTSGLRSLRLPARTAEIHELVVAADGDTPGMAAARVLADRAIGLGWAVRLMKPPEGRDFNDVHREALHG